MCLKHSELLQKAHQIETDEEDAKLRKTASSMSIHHYMRGSDAESDIFSDEDDERPPVRSFRNSKPPVKSSIIVTPRATFLQSASQASAIPLVLSTVATPVLSPVVTPVVSPVVTSAVSPVVTSAVSPVVTPIISEALASDDFRHALAEMQIKIDELTRRGTTSETRDYEFKGVDLIQDIEGKNYIKWSLKCSLHLFSKSDMMENCLMRSSKTTRGELDPEKVNLLKSNILLFSKKLLKIIYYNFF